MKATKRKTLFFILTAVLLLAAGSAHAIYYQPTSRLKNTPLEKKALIRENFAGSNCFGEQFDPNIGFYYLRARWYNPDNGRFTSVDPWLGAQLYPITLHRYLYAHSNPANITDPSGERGLIQMLVTGTMYAIVSVQNYLWYAGYIIRSSLSSIYNQFAAILRNVNAFKAMYCFPSGTMVYLSNGQIKAIEEIKIGDTLLAADPETMKIVTGVVTDTIRSQAMRLFNIVVENREGDDTLGVLKATSEHPIWTKEREWQSAQDIVKGDSIISKEGTYFRVESVSEVNTGLIQTFNLSVKGVNTFFIDVGGKSVLVHNVDPTISPVAWRESEMIRKLVHVKARGIEFSLRGGGNVVKPVLVHARDINNPQYKAALKDLNKALGDPIWREKLLKAANDATNFLKQLGPKAKAASGATNQLIHLEGCVNKIMDNSNFKDFLENGCLGEIALDQSIQDIVTYLGEPYDISLRGNEENKIYSYYNHQLQIGFVDGKVDYYGIYFWHAINNEISFPGKINFSIPFKADIKRVSFLQILDSMQVKYVFQPTKVESENKYYSIGQNVGIIFNDCDEIHSIVVSRDVARGAPI